MNSLSSQIILNIINQQMQIPSEQTWVRNQNVLIPNDDKLYVVAGITSAETLANSVYMQSEGTSPQITQHQISEVTQLENVQIDIFSRSNQAITRHWEIIAAIQSFYAQQIMELNNFKLFRRPKSFVDTSYAEGGSQLNRYTITISCLVWYRKDIVLTSPLGDYFDEFETRLDDYKTIGTDDPICEFEITPETPTPPYV